MSIESNTAAECLEQPIAPAARCRDAAVLLVGAARALGEPLDLYRAADRRRGRAVRLRDHGVRACRSCRLQRAALEPGAAAPPSIDRPTTSPR